MPRAGVNPLDLETPEPGGSPTGFFHADAQPHTAYAECLETMFALRRFGIKLGLATIRRMLAGLGNPHRRYRCIHIAGTNGKGSVASNLATILMKSGYRVGLYTSPHLVRFNERIQVDGEEITDAQIVRLYRRVQRALPGGREPTFFEFTTAMALDEFARRKVDWAVIETGMGGRLDATNVITPELSDHHEHLAGAPRIPGRDHRPDRLRKSRHRQTPPAGRHRASGSHRRWPSCLKRRDGNRRRSTAWAGFRVRRREAAASPTTASTTSGPTWPPACRASYQVENAALVLAACELLVPKAPQIDPSQHPRGAARKPLAGPARAGLAKPRPSCSTAPTTWTPPGSLRGTWTRI